MSHLPLVAIVDDEEDIILFLSMALQDHGFEVVSSATCDGAMALLDEHPPDLVCLDLLMPGQTGASLYHEIKHDEKLRDCPVIIMSGLGVRSEVEDLLRGDDEIEPPSAFLEKPINIDEMLGMLGTLTGRGVAAANCGGEIS